MKNFLILIAIVALFQLSSCKDDKVSGHDQNINLLTSSNWGNPTVINATDGDLSDQYTDFIMVFKNKSADGFDGTFVIGNGLYAFPETTGKWRFSEDLTKIIFDSGREIDFELSEKKLQLDFVVTPDGGRINGLSGHFTFDLQPQ